MLESITDPELKLIELSPEEKQNRGILGRLYGPVGSFANLTRNDRLYTDSLWEKVFDSDIVKEMFSCGGIPGELDHPADRDETCSDRIAVMMPEPPKKDKNGYLFGYFDIIDTPCGRIAYALAKYGFKLGISSRGSGNTYTDLDGKEVVDEDSYVFNGFDLVLLPACENARLSLSESMKRNFKKQLNESLKKSNLDDRKIMMETLDNLNIDYKEPSDETKTEDNATDDQKEADDNGSEVVNQLQEALKESHRLQSELVSVQEKLSVSYTKEQTLNERITSLQGTVKRLAESVAKSKAQSAQLETMKAQLEESRLNLDDEKRLNQSLRERLRSSMNSRSLLKESVASDELRIHELEEKLSTLQENLSKIRREESNKQNSLKEELSAAKADSAALSSQYSDKLRRSNKLVEKYKSIANQAVDKYIQSKALNLGIDAKEIKNHLHEGFSFDEIDSICEDLRSYRLNMSKLPFKVGGNTSVKGVVLKEDTSTDRFTNPDDKIDSSLLEWLK